MNYHSRIMNLATISKNVPLDHDGRIAYKNGHRDARHSAAELAIEADQKIEELSERVSFLTNLCTRAVAEGWSMTDLNNELHLIYTLDSE